MLTAVQLILVVVSTILTVTLAYILGWERGRRGASLWPRRRQSKASAPVAEPNRDDDGLTAKDHQVVATAKAGVTEYVRAHYAGLPREQQDQAIAEILRKGREVRANFGSVRAS